MATTTDERTKEAIADLRAVREMLAWHQSAPGYHGMWANEIAKLDDAIVIIESELALLQAAGR